MKITFLVPVLLSLTGSLTAQTNIFPATGPVGIGTTSPATNLHVYRNLSGQFTSLLTIEDGLSNGYTQMSFKGTGTEFHIGVGNNSEATFGIANKFYIWDQNALLPRMVLDANGNVGIGVTNPLATLHTQGTLMVTNASYSGNLKIGHSADNTILAMWESEPPIPRQSWR